MNVEWRQSSVAAATAMAMERNTWFLGTCSCWGVYKDDVRFISLPYLDTCGPEQDNRAIMNLDSSVDTGRVQFRALHPLPHAVAAHLVGGGHVRGTCLCCGDIVEIGVDLADEHGEGAGYEGAENVRGGGSEPTSAAARGKRWHRGWGRQPISACENGRRVGGRRVFVSPCL